MILSLLPSLFMVIYKDDIQSSQKDVITVSQKGDKNNKKIMSAFPVFCRASFVFGNIEPDLNFITFSKKEMKVLEMYLAHCSYEQIANELSMNEKSVDNALQRAKSKIRKSMGK